ncbi:serine/threonine dehydratase [Xenorhabdus vietnamensis]|uniref:Serine/threonine dehydratase n=1 Tax=Xenorhabdus vietnamensis TaxID=351656 RepID=A0A1Y2S8B6_9GAMM|nr:hypothetical protein [Xenorhabdus vietnamensis]OTA14850.1 serine/threonine dehydratase [Xenorhabdus vietnamensis]
MKTIVEPIGCLEFAAVKSMRKQLKEQHVRVILSGENIDMKLYAHLLGNKT